MIKIKRKECPTFLQKPEHKFVKNDYQKDEVKEVLLEMQHYKCCYCERDLKEGSSTEREVDHYIPVSDFKDAEGNTLWYLANKWENLLYACRPCNNKKRNTTPFNRTTNEREIIDPSFEEIDPEDHIDFVIDWPLINYKEKEGSSLGKSTIDNLGFIERKDLFRKLKKRKVEIENHFIELIIALEEDDIADIEAKKNELSRAMSAHLTFTAFNRNFIKNRLKQLNEDEFPKLETRYNKSFELVELEFPEGYKTKY